MAPRPHWKGFLKLSLVSCPVALFPAVSPAERISFRQIRALLLPQAHGLIVAGSLTPQLVPRGNSVQL